MIRSELESIFATCAVLAVPVFGIAGGEKREGHEQPRIEDRGGEEMTTPSDYLADSVFDTEQGNRGAELRIGGIGKRDAVVER